MKKRLFITSALMTAVMAASLATGTYAWYQASGSGGVFATSASTENLVTASPNINLTGNVDVVASLEEVTNSKLCLSEWVAGENKYKTYYLNSALDEVEYTRTTGAVAAKAYKIKVKVKTVSNAKITNDEQFNFAVSQLLNASLKITVASTQGRAHPFLSATALADEADYVPTPNGITINLSSSINDYGTFSDPKDMVIGYVAIWVDGNNVKEEDRSNVVDSNDVPCDFTVSIENNK